MFVAGPARFARFGRTTVVDSAWGPGEYERFRASWPDLRKEREASLARGIADAIAIVKGVDPLELLSALFLKNSVGDPTAYKESEVTPREHHAEYISSLVAAIPQTEFGTASLDDDTFQRATKVLDQIYDDVRHISALEPGRDSDDGIARFRFQMVLRHLSVRGDSYPEHHADLVGALLRPHDSYLIAKYGFSADEFLSTCRSIEAQVQSRLDATRSVLEEIRTIQIATHDAVQRALDEAAEGTTGPGGAAAAVTVDADTACDPSSDPSSGEGLTDAEGIERDSREAARELLQAFLPEGARERLGELVRALPRDGKGLLRVDLTDPRVAAAVVQALVCAPGENDAFLSGKHGGHPLNETLIWTKPLLRINGDVYCVSPPLLFRAMLGAVDALLSNDRAYSEKYLDARGKTLESLAVACLSKILPSATGGTSLYYRPTPGVRIETDAIFLFDRHLIVVEAKARLLSVPARRGAPQRMRDDFGKIVEAAFKQAARVREFVLGRDEAAFENEQGKTVLTVRRADIDEVIFINPTLAAMNPLGVQLGLAREHGLLSNDTQWPWCVFINDLRIIAELIDSPAEFLLFLKRRLATNLTPYAPHDEMDLLCKFFDDGLYHEPGELKGVGLISLHGFTGTLDAWYLKRPYGVDVRRPGRAIPSRTLALVRAIEATGKPHRTRAAMRLLEMDHAGLETIEAFLDSRGARALTDGREHDASLQVGKPIAWGLSIYASRSGGLSREAMAHSAKRKHLSGGIDWLAVSVSAETGDADFAFVADEPISSDLVQAANRTRYRLLAAYISQKKRLPARNEPCPCRSGRKFKKCCALLAADVTSHEL